MALETHTHEKNLTAKDPLVNLIRIRHFNVVASAKVKLINQEVHKSRNAIRLRSISPHL